LAIGHLLSLALVAAAVAWGVGMPRGQLQWLAGGLLLVAVTSPGWRQTR